MADQKDGATCRKDIPICTEPSSTHSHGFSNSVQLNHLIELKQKQASMSEEISARKQAENTLRQAESTSRQAEYAARQADSAAEQAKVGAEQAAETARQGKTILVFTVVTIIFVCRPETGI